MSRSLPAAETLLDASVAYLQERLMPELQGYHRFQTRVVINVLKIIARELRDAETVDAEEAASLRSLLGHDGSLDELENELAQSIREGHIPLDDPELIEHLRGSLANRLSINNPRWSR
ncbi:MAG: hypothetical protein H6883_13255 [Rhodobiaceae bacterium]|nr:hypothetical protein [Rhodobiaceae bacterium]MCC0057088.1 hypothetical protein [Rhodobiaceae bacterium]